MRGPRSTNYKAKHRSELLQRVEKKLISAFSVSFAAAAPASDDRHHAAAGAPSVGAAGLGEVFEALCVRAPVRSAVGRKTADGKALQLFGSRL